MVKFHWSCSVSELDKLSNSALMAVSPVTTAAAAAAAAHNIHHRFHNQCRYETKITWFTKSEYAFLVCSLESTVMHSIAWCLSRMHIHFWFVANHDSKYWFIHFAMHKMHNVLAKVKPHQLLTTLYFVINLGEPILFDVFVCSE